MKLRNVFLGGVAGIALLGTAAYAGVDANALAQQLQDQGFDRVEIKVGLSQVKVEGIRDGVKYEMVYDDATGALIKQETGAVSASDDTTPGVDIRRDARDFVDDNGNIEDNSSADDSGTDYGSGADDDRNDDDNHSGKDDDSDDDNHSARSGKDHASQSGEDGSDHDGEDDHEDDHNDDNDDDNGSDDDNEG